MTGQELREWRKGIGLSQTELGHHLGLKQITISRWERGLCRIKHPVLVASALKVLEEKLYEEEVARLETKVWVDCMKTYLPLEDVQQTAGYRFLSLEEGDCGQLMLYVCPVCARKHSGSVVAPT